MSPASDSVRLLRALLPLRFFLGFTFIFAGVDKLISPVFLKESGNGSIMQQLEGFTRDSPLTPLIQAIALPHPVIIGGLMALAELAIGLGVFLGLFYRPAAFFGFLTATLFFLTASWSTRPYYFGPDLPYAAGFLTLALVGLPGPYTVAGAVDSLAGHGEAEMEARRRREARRGRPSVEDTFSPERRAFLQAGVVGAVAIVAGGAAFALSRIGGLNPFGNDTTGGGGGGGGGGGASGGTIGTVSQISQQGYLSFTDPATGDPGYAVQINGQVLGYDAVCTHQGCQVQYAADQKIFACPCHGGEFDAAHQGAVIAGPPPSPLRQIALSVDAQGNVTVKS